MRSQIFLVSVALAVISAPSAAAPTCARQSNAELSALAAADKSDWSAQGKPREYWTAASQRNSERSARVKAIDASGMLCTAEDYLNAAYIKLHGLPLANTVEAIRYSSTAINLDAQNLEAKKVFAQAMDHLLVRTAGKQLYGTVKSSDIPIMPGAPVEAGIKDPEPSSP